MGQTSQGSEGLEETPSIHVCPVDRVDTQLVNRQQQAGTDIGVIYKALKEKRSLGEDEISCHSREFKKLAGLMPLMHIRKDGVLMVRVLGGNRATDCALFPETQRTEVVWETHRQAHTGVIRTIRKLRLVWFWPGMTADVRRLVGTCEVCQVAKNGGVTGATGKRRLHAGRPWQKLAVDLVGPMSCTPRGNKWILVITDHFTRWQDALAIPDATAPVVAAALDERVFCYLGLPEQIHAD
jgi:hypothetical protein